MQSLKSAGARVSQDIQEFLNPPQKNNAIKNEPRMKRAIYRRGILKTKTHEEMTGNYSNQRERNLKQWRGTVLCLFRWAEMSR